MVKETFEEKCARNRRVQARYDELIKEGRHGHYETIFRVVREEVERAVSESSKMIVDDPVQSCNAEHLYPHSRCRREK